MVHVQVVRGGEQKQVSIFDLVVGDVVPLSIGGQVNQSQILFQVVLLRGPWVLLLRLYMERWKICISIYLLVQVMEFQWLISFGLCIDFDFLLLCYNSSGATIEESIVRSWYFLKISIFSPGIVLYVAGASWWSFYWRSCSLNRWVNNDRRKWTSK